MSRFGIVGTTRVVAAVALMVAVACENALAPSDVVGTYALRAVGKSALPTELYRNEYVIVRVFADTLHLRSDGTATIASVRSTDPLQPGIDPTPPTLIASPAHYRLHDNRIEVAFDCPPNADCIPGPHLVAIPVKDGLEVDQVLTGHVLLAYTRVAATP